MERPVAFIYMPNLLYHSLWLYICQNKQHINAHTAHIWRPNRTRENHLTETGHVNKIVTTLVSFFRCIGDIKERTQKIISVSGIGGNVFLCETTFRSTTFSSIYTYLSVYKARPDIMVHLADVVLLH